VASSELKRSIGKGTQNEEEKQNESFKGNLEKEERKKLLEKVEGREEVSLLRNEQNSNNQNLKSKLQAPNKFQ